MSSANRGRWSQGEVFLLLKLLEKYHIATAAERSGRSVGAGLAQLVCQQIALTRFYVTPQQLSRETGYSARTLQSVADRLGVGSRDGGKRSRLRLLRHEAEAVVAWLRENALTSWDNPEAAVARAKSRRRTWAAHESRTKYLPGHRHGARTLVRQEMRARGRSRGVAWFTRCDAGHERWVWQYSIDRGQCSRCQECGWSLSRAPRIEDAGAEGEGCGA